MALPAFPNASDHAAALFLHPQGLHDPVGDGRTQVPVNVREALF
jgi:hypothetical protein